VARERSSWKCIASCSLRYSVVVSEATELAVCSGNAPRREPERTAFGVLADCPRLARMDNDSAERLDLLQRLWKVLDPEIRQRERISGTTPSHMYPNCRTFRPRMPACTLAFAAGLERHAEQLAPEAPCAVGVVGGELHERDRR